MTPAGGFVGADPDALDSLAARYRLQSEKVSEIITSSSAALFTAQWTGAKIDGIRAQWNQKSRPQLLFLEHSLREAGEALRVQAQQQRATSAGRNAGLVDGSTLDPELRDRIEQIVGDFFAGALTSTELLTLLLELDGLDLSAASKITGPIGLITSAIEAAKGVHEDGDYFGYALSLLGASFSAVPWAGHLAGLSGTVATTAATGFGVVGLGVALLHKWIDFGIPYTPSAQDETIQEGIRKMYGDGVTQESLTPAQAQRVAERYSPPFGVAVMISDKMDSVAQRIFPWNR